MIIFTGMTAAIVFGLVIGAIEFATKNDANISGVCNALAIMVLAAWAFVIALITWS